MPDFVAIAQCQENRATQRGSVDNSPVVAHRKCHVLRVIDCPGRSHEQTGTWRAQFVLSDSPTNLFPEGVHKA